MTETITQTRSVPANKAFYPDGDGSRFIRIPFCGVNERGIRTAIASIGEAVRNLG